MNGADERDLLARLAAELDAAPPIDLQLPAASALAVTAALQLALRHPRIPRGPAAIVRAVIEEIADLSGPVAREVINADLDADDDRVASLGVAGLVPPAPLFPDWIREAMQIAIDGGSGLAQRHGFGDVVVGPPHFAVDWGRVAGRDSDVAIYAAPPMGPSLTERLLVDVDQRIPPDTLVLVSGDPAHPERGGDAVVRRISDIPIVEEGRRPLGVVRPAGLVWSGIRVDEMERLYEVLGPDHEACPVKLEDGEIYGDPPTGRVFVWSLADFRRLADLSRFLHELRRRGLRTPLTASERELGERWQTAIRAANTGAPSIDVVRALPAGGES